MKVIGLSPLHHNTSVCLLEDGKILAVIHEERLNRQAIAAGFPYSALEYLFRRYQLSADDIVAYAGLDASTEIRMLTEAQRRYEKQGHNIKSAEIFAKFRKLSKQSTAPVTIPGFSDEALYKKSPRYKETWYALASKVNIFGRAIQKRSCAEWVKTVTELYEANERELLQGIQKFALFDKLVRLDYHRCSAAHAYYSSGFNEALVATFDDYGSGLTGNVAIGNEKGIECIHELRYPTNLGQFCEQIMSALDLHYGYDGDQLAELATYGDPDILIEALYSLFEVKDGDIIDKLPHSHFFGHYLASSYSKPSICAALQKVLEKVVCDYISYYQQQTGLKNLVLSGNVIGNSKLNQRLAELSDTDNIFIPAVIDASACCVGAAFTAFLQTEWADAITPSSDIYLGPGYTTEELENALRQEGLTPETPEYPEQRIAELLAGGKVVAHFDGRTEYSSRALGNRSILYHANDSDLDEWLKTQLKRPVFLTPRPATLYEYREQCYQNVQGIEDCLQRMTLSVDCTDFMKERCPVGVRRDGTACPQLVHKEINTRFHRILEEYYRLTDNPTIINTNLNMNREPIACTPLDAIRVFKLGRLHYLAMGPFLVKGLL